MGMRKAKVPESTPMVICGLDYGRMERETVTVSNLNAKMENHEETSREAAQALAPDQVAVQLLSALPPPPESKVAPPQPAWKAEA